MTPLIWMVLSYLLCQAGSVVKGPSFGNCSVWDKWVNKKDTAFPSVALWVCEGIYFEETLSQVSLLLFRPIPNTPDVKETDMVSKLGEPFPALHEFTVTSEKSICQAEFRFFRISNYKMRPLVDNFWVSLGPPRSGCQKESWRCKVVMKRNVWERKWGRSWKRLGEPSEHDASLTLIQ